MMPSETIGHFGEKSCVDRVEDGERSFLLIVEKTDGNDGVYAVREIARTLADIVDKTELPTSFEVKETTSSHNDKVRGKMELISKTPGLDVDKVIPERLVEKYPVDFNEETLKEAPWVNMVHGWMKVLNCLNSVSAIQKKEQGELNDDDIDTLFGIAYDLYKMTLRGPEELKRKGLAFSVGKRYSETFRRESGELGVNAERKINFLELRYILNVVKESYSKDREK